MHTFVRWYDHEVVGNEGSNNGYISIYIPSGDSTTTTFTLPSDYWVAIDDGQLRGGVEYTNIMIEKGTTATEYKPYHEAVLLNIPNAYYLRDGVRYVWMGEWVEF